MHPLVERILEKRNITDREVFLNPSYHERPDPFLMKDMDRAVERILRAIKDGEKIAVWHDYDCDGVPGGALLFDFFQAIGYPVLAYVPERSEGYGLNEEGITQLKDTGVSLMITVDCGITDNEEVAYAALLGVDVIVTDHHLPLRAEAIGEGGPSEVLPSAVAVLNPHRSDCEYPFKELCGTGVAFKLVEGLIERGEFKLTEGQEKWLLDLVALATVADMVPLVGENRVLVHFGLVVIRKGRRPGLKALFEAERVSFQNVVEDDLAFSIAPKINASSRMSSPKKAFELLTTMSHERAKEIAKELIQLNQSRKLEGMRVAKEVKHRIEAAPSLGDIIVAGHTSWRPSLLGIAATSVVETYKKTVCLWGKDGDIIKGSCRSNGSVNIVELLRAADHAFTDFGGHEFSGGFSVSLDAVHTLSEKLESALRVVSINGGITTPHELREPEGLLALSEANEAAYEALRHLAPFGQGNPKPLFRIEGVRVEKLFRFGGHKEHAKILLSDESGIATEAISFFISRTSYHETFALLSPGDSVTVDASLERSAFRGKPELRLRIESLTLAT